MIYSAEALRVRRTELKLTQAQMANLLGVNGGTVYQWERERRHPEEDNLDRLELFLTKDIESIKEAISQIDRVSHPYPTSAFHNFLVGDDNYLEAGFDQEEREERGRLSLTSIPFEERPAGADSTSLPRSRFGPKNDYALQIEARYEIEQAREQLKLAHSQMAAAQMRLDAAVTRLSELIHRQSGGK